MYRANSESSVRHCFIVCAGYVGAQHKFRRADVRCGRTAGSDRKGMQERGPSRRYVSRNISSASLRSSPDSDRSIRITVSGESSPCEDEKDGSVSQLAKADDESDQLDVFRVSFCCSLRIPVYVVVDSIFWAAMGGVCDEGEAGAYIVIVLLDHLFVFGVADFPNLPAPTVNAYAP